MKPKWVLLLVVALILTNTLVKSAKGQADIFVIEGADAMVDLTVRSSPDLFFLANNIIDRFIVEFANEQSKYEIQPVPGDLQELINTIGVRPVIEFANESHYYQLSYPKDILTDVAPPQLIWFSISPWNSNTIRVVLETNEYTILLFEYGTEPGIYSSSIAVNDFTKQHRLLINELDGETIFYYRFTLIDQSGNVFNSGESTYAPSRAVYFPFLTK